MTRQQWAFWGAAVFLVSVPVFFQAPLVRAYPLLSLILTPAWLALGRTLQTEATSKRWGDLIVGFTWTWLAGSLYWGWLRHEPLLHLPVEAIGLPFALICLIKRRNRIGNWFYIGSLFGTCMTDLYFYIVDLIPHWRQLMQVDISLAKPIFQDAVMQIETPWGMGWAAVLVLVLVLVGFLPLRLPQLHWRVFSGAVLSTVLVDGLFWIAATSV